MGQRRRPEERGYYDADDDAAENFFRQAAKNEGLTYHAWCDKYGILDTAALRVVHRHEVPLHQQIASKGHVSDVNRQGRYTHRWAHRVASDSADRNWQVDPPFKVRLASDFDPEPEESPVRRRPSGGPVDAAAE